jgi:2Fe-2S ferredoxin
MVREPMVKITYVANDGRAFVVETEPGISLMEAARRNNVPGIDADCSGACACGTCHVYIDANWQTKLPPKDVTEEGMLEYAERSGPTSRLSCQIRITEELDGLVVRMPLSQH